MDPDYDETKRLTNSTTRYTRTLTLHGTRGVGDWIFLFYIIVSSHIFLGGVNGV